MKPQAEPQNMGMTAEGFVSISWKLPKRYTAEDFLCDARNSTNVSCGTHYVPSSDDYVHSLGEAGSGASGLLPGDAFVGRIISFYSTATFPMGVGFWRWNRHPLRQDTVSGLGHN